MSHQVQQAHSTPTAKVITVQQRSRASIGLLLRWIVCHLLLALLLLAPLLLMPPGSMLPTTLGFPILMGELVVVLTLGAWVGLAQVLALSRSKTQVRQSLINKWWMLTFLGGFASIASIITAIILGNSVSNPSSNFLPTSQLDGLIESISTLLVPAFAGGAALGAVQWRVLRHHSKHAIWWIPVNGIGWGLGATIGLLSAEYAYSITTNTLESVLMLYMDGLFFYSALTLMIMTGLAVAVAGIVTAGPLGWLLRPSSRGPTRVYRWRYVARERDNSDWLLQSSSNIPSRVYRWKYASQEGENRSER